MKVIHLNRSSKATRWLDVKQQLWWSPVFHLVSGRKPLGHQVNVVVAEGQRCQYWPVGHVDKDLVQRVVLTKSSFRGTVVAKRLQPKQPLLVWASEGLSWNSWHRRGWTVILLKVIALVFIAIVMCLHNINIWLVSIIGKASMWLWSEVEDSFSDKMLHRVT